MAREGCTREEALLRINSQMSQREKAAHARVLIDNSGGIAQLRRRVEEAYYALKKANG